MSADLKKEDRLLEHNYDGIQEYDNPMPQWWLWLFYATIVFSVLYWFNVAGVGTGPGRIANYEKEVAAARQQFGDRSAGLANLDNAALLAASHDPAAVAAGKATFVATCAACHLADGGGVVGPNLTDDFWIHGNEPVQMLGTVANGVLDKGMPAWNQTLKPEEIKNVVAYVLTLRGTTPAVPKEPQGTQMAPYTGAETPAAAQESTATANTR